MDSLDLDKRLRQLETERMVSDDDMFGYEMSVFGTTWWKEPPDTKVVIIGGPKEQYCAGLEYLRACTEAKEKGLPKPSPSPAVVMRTVRELKEEYRERFGRKR